MMHDGAGHEVMGGGEVMMHDGAGHEVTGGVGDDARWGRSWYLSSRKASV